MAVSPSDLILASQFNTLRNRTASLLGNGVSDFGYGQSVQSNEVSAGAVITAARLATLKNDMARVHLHQTGNPFPLDTIATGDVVGADDSGDGLTFDNQGDYTFNNLNASKGYNDYLSLLTTLENNRFDIHPSQSDIELAVAEDDRTQSWGAPDATNEDPTPESSIVSVFTVTFSTSDARRHFFNSGGEIRISGVVPEDTLDIGSPSFSRNQGWKDMIENPGQVRLGYNYILASASGASNIVFQNGTNFGNSSITSTYREIFRKNAAGNVYENSYWKVEVRNDSSTVIRFRLTLVDAGSETNVYPDFTKEPVTADIRMDYGARRAQGDPSGGSVTVPFPTFTVVNSFQ